MNTGNIASQHQVDQLRQYVTEGVVTYEEMEDFLKKFADLRESLRILNRHREEFKRMVARCRCDAWGEFSPENFDEVDVGKLGKGRILARPPRLVRDRNNNRYTWFPDEIEAWLAGPEVAGVGLEAASPRDLLEQCFLCYEGDSLRTMNDLWFSGRTLVAWSPSKKGLVAYMYWRGCDRYLGASVMKGDWNPATWFLLREIQR